MTKEQALKFAADRAKLCGHEFHVIESKFAVDGYLIASSDTTNLVREGMFAGVYKYVTTAYPSGLIEEDSGLRRLQDAVSNDQHIVDPEPPPCDCGGWEDCNHGNCEN